MKSVVTSHGDKKGQEGGPGMNLAELIAGIEGELGTGISDFNIQGIPVEVDDTQEDLVKAILGVWLENGRLVIRVG
jgi:hypothetical protein